MISFPRCNIIVRFKVPFFLIMLRFPANYVTFFGEFCYTQVRKAMPHYWMVDRQYPPFKSFCKRFMGEFRYSEFAMRQAKIKRGAISAETGLVFCPKATLCHKSGAARKPTFPQVWIEVACHSDRPGPRFWRIGRRKTSFVGPPTK